MRTKKFASIILMLGLILLAAPSGLQSNNADANAGTPAQGWLSLSVAGNHSLAVRADGTLWGWGVNDKGQLGDGTFNNSNMPVRIGKDSNWKQVSTSANYTLAVKSDGTLWGWGSNEYKLLDISAAFSKVPVRIGGEKTWQFIEAGSRQAIGLRLNGSMWHWGLMPQGGVAGITRLTATNDWAQLSVGSDEHFLALKKDGSLWAWGNNGNGQLGLGNDSFPNVPVRVGQDKDWTGISAAAFYSVATKKDGSVWQWGSRNDSNKPVQIVDADPTTAWKQLSSNEHTIAVRADGSLLLDGSLVGQDRDWLMADTSLEFSVAIKKNGSVWSFGRNDKGQLGNGSSTSVTSPIQISQGTNWGKVVHGVNHSAAVLQDGSLLAWGSNQYRQLGNGGISASLKPVQVGSDKDWVDVAVTNLSTLALKKDGTLWAWGSNGNFAFGKKGVVTTSQPVQIGTDTTWASITGSKRIAAATKKDGSLWIWGTDVSQSFYPNESKSISEPLQIGQGGKWKKVAIGGNDVRHFMVAIRQDGTVWGWGIYADLMRTGSRTIKQGLTQIGKDANWADAVTGDESTLLLKRDGTLWYSGRMLTAPLLDYNEAGGIIRLGTDKDWTSLAAGNHHFMALKKNGTLWSLGSNSNGQLGQGSLSNAAAMKQIGQANNWALMSGGINHSMGIKQDGTLWGWGDNSKGQYWGAPSAYQPEPAKVVFK